MARVLLDGRVLQAAEAHGKQMFLAFSGEHWLRVHLGLYGMWRFAGPGLAGFGRARRGRATSRTCVPPEPGGAGAAAAAVAGASWPT